MKRRRNAIVIFVIIIVFVIARFIGPFKHGELIHSHDGNELFRGIDHLILTKHARCRMDCRHITIDEIKEILKNGDENYAKNVEGSKGDKTYTLEGYSAERQHIRVVVAPKNDGVVVITCIDLDKEWPCNCN